MRSKSPSGARSAHESVGGGIAGLTAAYEIRKARQAARVLLLENRAANIGWFCDGSAFGTTRG